MNIHEEDDHQMRERIWGNFHVIESVNVITEYIKDYCINTHELVLTNSNKLAKKNTENAL